jgi:hypothetical protein
LFMFVICCSLKSLLICWFFTGHSWVVHLFSTPFMCMGSIALSFKINKIKAMMFTCYSMSQ